MSGGNNSLQRLQENDENKKPDIHGVGLIIDDLVNHKFTKSLSSFKEERGDIGKYQDMWMFSSAAAAIRESSERSQMNAALQIQRPVDVLGWMNSESPANDQNQLVVQTQEIYDRRQRVNERIEEYASKTFDEWLNYYAINNKHFLHENFITKRAIRSYSEHFQISLLPNSFLVKFPNESQCI